MQHCADFVQNSSNQEPLQKCFRSLEYIFKFIIQSRLLFARATEGQYEETFRKDLFSLFKALSAMLSKNNPKTLNTQVFSKNKFLKDRSRPLHSNLKQFFSGGDASWYIRSFRAANTSSADRRSNQTGFFYAGIHAYQRPVTSADSGKANCH